ncbi:hypothetical protein T265_09694 [Opisthorchis viverrini]|uniref:Uncharacterized protein n=1 Tax=Opisthorchis viverrini TaxID=6198 RepID=A0A075A417_OPIVI|nr:hypothetical protein T265_09694 [Opisthorchis viverrini]KER22124.1 hypothetical protein T265_09694 [Opisthorchis viverrini]
MEKPVVYFSSTRARLFTKGRVYQATVRAVLLYGCETWPIRAADLRRLQVFDRTIARVGWCQRIRNEAVRKRVFGCVTGCGVAALSTYHAVETGMDSRSLNATRDQTNLHCLYDWQPVCSF